MKRFFIGFGIFLLIIAATYFYFFHLKVGAKLQSINAVPQNAVFIIDIEDPFDQWNNITQGEIWNFLKTNKILSDLGNRIDSLNQSFQENQFVLDMLASRPVMVSAHKIRGDDFGLLYVIDLTEASRFSFVKDYLENLVGDDMQVTKRGYHGSEIIELAFKNSHKLLYLYIKNNLIVVSSTHTLIENSIDQIEEPAIARNLDYLDVSKLMDDDGIKLYLQHSYFKAYASKWMNQKETASPVYAFIESILFSAINIKIDNQFLSFSGYSSLNDSLNSYAKIIHNSGVGKTELHQVVPENSLFFLSMGFKSFTTFYKNIEAKISASDEADEYFKNKEKLENYLNISVEEHFLSWIGGEAGVLQIQPTENSKTSGYAVAFKASDIDLAKEKLNYLKQQIKKKTPVKFKGIEYKGYKINFLSVKGLFKVLLGKMFSKLDKPYYTIIDDFVIFSNQPGTLAQLINYNIDDKTLQNNEQFDDYFDQFSSKSSLFFYINSKQIVPYSKEFLSVDYWKVMNSNKSYIESFPLVGVQILPKKKLLSTSIIFNYMPKQEFTDWSQLFTAAEPVEFDSAISNKPNIEEQVAVEDIFPDELDDNKLIETHKNGVNRIEVSLKDGLKDGSYKEYDSLGNVIVKGRYKKNKKTSTWKYYDSDGNLLRKEKF